MVHANRIQILVIHGDPVVHAGLSAALARHDDLEVVVAPREEGFDPACRAADVVVADYPNGIDAAAACRRRRDAHERSHPRVLIVGNSDREWEVRRAMEQGVNGYIRAGCTLDELAAGVRDVYRGLRHLSPQVAQRLADMMSGDALTNREEQVLHLLVTGLGNKLIARQLGIAQGTVKSHLKRIFDKLRVDSRTQAIRVAECRGLLSEADAPLHGARHDLCREAERGFGRAAPPIPRSAAQADHVHS